MILTEWKEFANLDPERVKPLVKQKVIFDGRNLLDKEKVQDYGFVYFAVGKRTNGLDKVDEPSESTVPSALLKNGQDS